MAILFYDGTCGLCARSVQWVLAHERRDRTLRFASLQGPRAASIAEIRRMAPALDSVIWFEPGDDAYPARVLTRSAAVLAVWRHVGGPWRGLAAVGRLVPRVARDRLYDLIARHRHSLAGPACVLPTEEQRERFLDALSAER
jgi:predicted DCC family thiol-disulfide oxidoreductase YuxK